MLSLFTPERSAPATLGTALFGAGLVASLLWARTPLHAHAASACRSDPIVVLSDGMVLDLSATIADDISDVQQITYVLHVPDRSTVARAVSTDGAVGYKEQFQVQSDSTPGLYTTTVQVQTRTQGVAVTAMILGGYAAQLGVTPAMVGLSSFTSTTTTSVHGNGSSGGKGPSAKGANALMTLPGTMSAAVAAWAASAPWSANTSTQGLAGAQILASVSL